MTLAVIAYPLGRDMGLERARRGTPLRVYRRALAWRANPRPPEYMRALLAEHWPDAVLVHVDEDDLDARLRDADEVVLVYPDAIGLGFGALERRVARATSGRIPQVLTGRRRRFALDRRTHHALRLRRALERSMVGEAAGLLLVALATVPLAAFDMIRGRR